MIKEHERVKIYNDAIIKWGNEPQIDMVVEECSELINAIQKHKRGRNTIEEILDEVADVNIMLEQLTLMLTRGKQLKPHEICDKKLERLKGRLYG